MLHEVAKNLELWNGWADLHMSGAYDVDGFIADPSKRPFDWVIQEVVGDVAGKRLLHLQCHVGLDTMRFGLAGATNLTGVDFSPKAIAAARSIAERLGVSATFIEADVAALPESVPVSAFDVVFTSYGTIMWLPDLKPWAEGIASRLAPGGVFHIIDVHPFLTVFDDFATEPPLQGALPVLQRRTALLRGARQLRRPGCRLRRRLLRLAAPVVGDPRRAARRRAGPAADAGVPGGGLGGARVPGAGRRRAVAAAARRRQTCR